MARSASPYKVLIAATVLVLLLLFTYSVAKILLLLFVAVLFGLFLGATADYLERRFRLPRWAGLPAGLFLVLLGFTTLGMLIIPPVSSRPCWSRRRS
jgi:predicted PurR-regulated permease PerM